MTRALSPAFAEALAAAELCPVVFFEGEFASGTVRIWTGLGEVSWDGKTWTGLGGLLSFGAIEETNQVVASGTMLSLSAVPVDLVALAISEAQQGKPGRLWLGLLSETGEIIADPVKAFAGRLDVPEITDNATTCTLTLSYESRLIDLTIARAWRYTSESQQVLHPGDRGFDYVTTIQDKEITWGRG